MLSIFCASDGRCGCAARRTGSRCRSSRRVAPASGRTAASASNSRPRPARRAASRHPPAARPARPAAVRRPPRSAPLRAMRFSLFALHLRLCARGVRRLGVLLIDRAALRRIDRRRADLIEALHPVMGFLLQPAELAFFMALFRPMKIKPSGYHTTKPMMIAHHGNWNGPSPAWYSSRL